MRYFLGQRKTANYETFILVKKLLVFNAARKFTTVFTEYTQIQAMPNIFNTHLNVILRYTRMYYKYFLPFILFY
jgi:hypothetical protein